MLPAMAARTFVGCCQLILCTQVAHVQERTQSRRCSKNPGRGEKAPPCAPGACVAVPAVYHAAASLLGRRRNGIIFAEIGEGSAAPDSLRRGRTVVFGGRPARSGTEWGFSGPAPLFRSARASARRSPA